jgi:hypothetical protein
MIAAARTLVRRDLLLALRRPSDVGTALLFFVIVASLFPLGIGAEPNLLRAVAPGVIWVAALLSSMLSLSRLFAADHADGTLEQGFEVVFHFCQTCGSTVYWEPERKPGLIAVAVGCFGEPGFPMPSKSVFTEHQHPWLSLSI